MSKCHSGGSIRWIGVAGSLVVGLAFASHPGPAWGADATPVADPGAAEKTSLALDPGSPEEALFKRADAYWNAVANNGDIAPFFPVTKKGRRWIDRKRLGATDYEILGVWVDGDRGFVQLRATIRPGASLSQRIKELPDDTAQRILKSSRTERWQLKDGEWYRKRSRRGLSRLMKRDRTPAPEAAATTGEAAPERQPEQKNDQTEESG